MKLTELTPTNQNQVVVDSFGGYNHNIRIGDGEFYDMKHMTTDHAPALSSGVSHGRFRDVLAFKGMHAKDELIWGEGNDLYIGDKVFPMVVPDVAPKTRERQFISMGAYLLIFPDGRYINTSDTSDWGWIEATYQHKGRVKYSMCNEDAEDYDDAPAQPEAPENPKAGDYWIDTSEEKHQLKQYSASMSMWVSIATTFIKINAPNIARDFKVNDGLFFEGLGSSHPEEAPDMPDVEMPEDIASGMPEGGYDKYYDIYTPLYGGTVPSTRPVPEIKPEATTPEEKEEIEEYDPFYESVKALRELNGKYSVIYGAHHDEENPSKDYILVTGFIDMAFEKLEYGIEIRRDMPYMDYIVESNNRLWGCRYGVARNGKTVNEIYACKLGDFKNWNCFMGVSTDSYVASVGTDGKFTGAISYGGYPIFFKENNMHKVFGNYPANYQIQNTPCRGVQDGAWKSLAIVGESLLYKTRNGVAIYDGSLPVEISNAFGGIRYSETEDGDNVFTNPDKCKKGATAGALGQKYFISMKSEVDKKWYVFSFDLATNMWMKEEEMKVEQWCRLDDTLYFFHRGNQGKRPAIDTWKPSEGETVEPVEWMVESGRIGLNANGKKYISRYVIKMLLEVGATANVFIQYDSEDKWRHIQTLKGINVRTVSFPIRPRRCDHFRIKIEGKGDAKIFSITKVIEEGSDV